MEPTEQKRDFDAEAAAWDEDPGRVRLAGAIAAAMRETLDLTADMTVLDFGCGTGLITLALCPQVKSVTGVDSSQGMLRVLEAKIGRQNIFNVSTSLLDGENPTLPGGFDLIVSSMTLHHIADIAPLLGMFFQSLAPGGRFMIADLDLDDGKFHHDSTGVHHQGFDRAALRASFAQAGFTGLRDRTAAEFSKPAADGTSRQFSVFIVSGCKPAD